MRIVRGKKLVPLAIAVLVAACSSSATPAPSLAPLITVAPGATAALATPTPPPAPGTLTVWIMNGSLSDPVASQLNTKFEESHPGWKVNYQVQQWGGIVNKLTTALASNNPPDVFEMGNTQAVTFEAADALADLTGSRAALGGGTSNVSADPGQAWLASLNDASMYNGKLMAVPFYAGDRVLIYRTDLLAASKIDPATITSKAKLIAAAQQLQKDNASVKDFSGLYLPGQNWYALIQMIWDEGGQIATQSNGTWTSTLSSPAAQKGIQDYVDYYAAGSTGPMNNDEANPQQNTLFQQGKVGMYIGNGWEIGGSIGTTGAVTKASQVAAMPIPSVNDGKTVPVFLGGSVIGIPKNTKNMQAALDWVAQLSTPTGQNLEIGLGEIPSLKAYAANIADTPANATLKIQAAEAAAASGFTPNAKGWAAVEANNPLKAMLTSILTKQATVDAAAKAADTKVSAVINGQ